MPIKKDTQKGLKKAGDETKAEVEEAAEVTDTALDEEASEKFEDDKRNEVAEVDDKPKRVTKAGPKSAKALAEAEAEAERKDKAAAKAEAPKAKPSSKPNP